MDHCTTANQKMCILVTWEVAMRGPTFYSFGVLVLFAILNETGSISNRFGRDFSSAPLTDVVQRQQSMLLLSHWIMMNQLQRKNLQRMWK